MERNQNDAQPDLHAPHNESTLGELLSEQEPVSEALTVVDEPPEEKVKGKGKPKQHYLPEHILVNTKFIAAITIVFVIFFALGGYLIFDATGRTQIIHTTSVPIIVTVTNPPLDSNFVPVPTSTMRFDSGYTDWSYPVALTKRYADIDAGTRVTIHQGYFNGTEWIYGVTSEYGGYFEVPESMLAPVQDDGQHIVMTPTATFNDLIGMGVYWITTTETIGDIPANTRVRVSSAWFSGTTWMYDIATEDGRFNQAQQSQLAYAPDVTPGAPTPTLAG